MSLLSEYEVPEKFWDCPQCGKPIDPDKDRILELQALECQYCGSLINCKPVGPRTSADVIDASDDTLAKCFQNIKKFFQSHPND
jgi:DNA-directed RNA polymerase subunit RPC12/RpoP